MINLALLDDDSGVLGTFAIKIKNVFGNVLKALKAKKQSPSTWSIGLSGI